MRRHIAIHTALVTLCLGISTSAGATTGTFGPKVTLSCDFPAAEATQKVKPTQSNVSDGVIRISPETMHLDICNGCTWKKAKAKWKVTPTHYVLNTGRGVEISIARKDGSALFVVTSAEDELYFSGRVESRGQCTLSEPAKNQKSGKP